VSLNVMLHHLVPALAAAGNSEGGEMHQPGPNDFWQPLIHIGGNDNFAITRPALVALATVAVIGWFFVSTARSLSVVPSRKQWYAEQAYDFVRNTIGRDVIGAKDFKPFLPLLLTVFFFILLNNVVGIIPFVQFPTMSRIAFPLVLALIVYVVYNVTALKRKHGLIGYLKSLVPPGIPPGINVLVFVIELATYLIIRPVTLALRLFGNMLAGHMLLLVFFVGAEYLLFESQGIGMKAAGAVSFAGGVLMTFFELLVEVLQAFIFTMLTAVYIADAVSDHH
jgi:F-type H+-transporting ATPase subunit a